jgi:hypothetical protein
MTAITAPLTIVVVRFDRTIQYVAADVYTGAGVYWMPAGACHRAARCADPLAGMTTDE